MDKVFFIWIGFAEYETLDKKAVYYKLNRKKCPGTSQSFTNKTPPLNNNPKSISNHTNQKPKNPASPNHQTNIKSILDLLWRLSGWE